MKNLRLFKLFLMAVLVVFASCKKDDSDVQNAVNEVSTIVSDVLPAENGGIRGVDPSGTLNALANTYGDTYVFSSKKRGQAVTNDNSTVYLCVVPFFMDDNYWLTILLDNSANVIGLYEIEYESKSASSDLNEGRNRQGYSFNINNVDTFDRLLCASVSTNVYGMQDRLHVYNNISIYNYPYPLFDNIASGYFNLSSYSQSFPNETIPELADIALRVAATFYNNFY